MMPIIAGAGVGVVVIIVVVIVVMVMKKRKSAKSTVHNTDDKPSAVESSPDVKPQRIILDDEKGPVNESSLAGVHTEMNIQHTSILRNEDEDEVTQKQSSAHERDGP